MVNELRGGWQWSPNNFFANITADMFAAIRAASASTSRLSTDPGVPANDPAPRNTTNWSIENTLNWLKGAHSLSMGGSFRADHPHPAQRERWCRRSTFGVDTTNDPANAMFNTTNFPGASTANLTEARSIYALLTGRVTAVTGTARLDAATGKYVYLGDLLQKSRHELASTLYAQDSWRVTPTLTVNDGLRWDVQLPFTPLTNTWSTATLADLCGISGIGSGPGGRAVQPVPARRAAGRRRLRPDVRAVRAGRAPATRPTGTTSRRTSASRGGRTCRAACCARCSAIPNRRRSAPATR